MYAMRRIRLAIANLRGKGEISAIFWHRFLPYFFARITFRHVGPGCFASSCYVQRIEPILDPLAFLLFVVFLAIFVRWILLQMTSKPVRSLLRLLLLSFTLLIPVAQAVCRYHL